MLMPTKMEVDTPIKQEAIKAEPGFDSPSPEMDYVDDGTEEGGDLDFGGAQNDFWLGHVPKSLWEALTKMNDNDEIELGTVRVEGSLQEPSRVSLQFNKGLSSLNLHPKEYNLRLPPLERRRMNKQGSSFIFSEKDLPGYKSKTFGWDEDEEGNGGQGRSYLYEKTKREIKKKENKGRFVPYAKRPIPKQTAITGTINKEFELAPVKNEEFYKIEVEQARHALKIPEKQEARYAAASAGIMQGSGLLSMADRAAINKASQARKQTEFDSRAARIEKPDLIRKLMDLFAEHKYWRLRDLKNRVQQPEAWLKTVLEDIAFSYKNGDFAGCWELKDEYKQTDSRLLNASSIAPKAESDVEHSAMEEDDDEEVFEDVQQ